MHYVNPAWRGSASAWAEKQQLDRGGGWSLSIPGANLGNTGSVLRLVWQPLFNFKVNSALIDDGYMCVCACVCVAASTSAGCVASTTPSAG